MIHQIKALHNNGNGLSERKTARRLGISRHTVSLYLNMSEAEITDRLSETERTKKQDAYVIILFNCCKPILIYQPLKFCVN